MVIFYFFMIAQLEHLCISVCSIVLWLNTKQFSEVFRVMQIEQYNIAFEYLDHKLVGYNKSVTGFSVHFYPLVMCASQVPSVRS